MDFIHLKQILDYAASVHQSLIPRVNFEKNDKKHAIYLIQGGVLTTAFTALKFNLDNYYAQTSQQKRLIDEAIDLIWFLDEDTNEEQSRQLKAWFNGKIVEREPGNSGNLTMEDRAKINLLTKEQIQHIHSLQKQLNNITSKMVHPTITAMRANSSKSSHIFDYDNLLSKELPFNSKDFGNMFVIPALYSLLIPVRHLLLPKKDFDQLRSFVSEIEESGS